LGLSRRVRKGQHFTDYGGDITAGSEPRRRGFIMRPTTVALFTAAIVTAFTWMAEAVAASPRTSDDFGSPVATTSWSSAGNGASDHHNAPFELLINPFTVPKLRNGEVWGTPTVEGDAVYASDTGGSVWRIDARSGRPVWEIKLSAYTGIATSFSRVSPAIGKDTIIIGDQASATIFAISKETGALVWKTTLATNRLAFITSSPTLVNGRIYVGVASDQEVGAVEIPGFKIDFRGSVAALDLNDGKIVWTYTVPAGYTGGAVWSSNLPVDSRRRAIYADTGNNYSVPDAVAACQLRATTNAQLDACLDPNDHIDSVLSLDIDTGAVKWADRFTHADNYTDSCPGLTPTPATPCPLPAGVDSDFGAAPNLLTIHSEGTERDVVGAGQKTGVYWELDRDTGKILWGTQVGPGGHYGGIEYGTATDGERIYVPEGNFAYVETTLYPSGKKTNGGYWSALDPATGRILWQTPTTDLAIDTPFAGTPYAAPAGGLSGAYGSVSVADGVMFGEDQAGTFVALDTANGKTLFSFKSGGASISGPAIAAGSVYWSSGYRNLGPTNNKIYAFGFGRW